MKINFIKLNNIGSYNGEVSFETNTTKEKNIILIGGKNGTGKTTLFNSVKICLYGYMSMGYKAKNHYYYKEIYSFINNSIKLTKPNNAYISISLSIVEGNEENTYILKRGWTISDTIIENFSVSKNENILNDEEIADFEKYISNLIPPELFNLYFFDGEKIADFFMNEENKKNLKNAFLTLCGYDTFEIMKKNFKRVSNKNEDISDTFDNYLSAKDELKEITEQYKQANEELEECKVNIFNCDTDLDKNEENYFKKGGITEEKWNKIFNEIKEKEDEKNILSQKLKVISNEKMPFLIILNLLKKLKNQISEESKIQKTNLFNELISSKGLSEELTKETGFNSDKIITIIKNYINDHNQSNSKIILNLSEDQKNEIFSQIYQIEKFDINKIYQLENKRVKLKEKISNLRKRLNNTNKEELSYYLQRKIEFSNKKEKLILQKDSLEKKVININDELMKKEAIFFKQEKEIKELLKQKSISDISKKSILMLDKLGELLYYKQINKIENNFKNLINFLTHKKNFIDDIHIDNDFGIHIYKEDKIKLEKIYNILYEQGIERVEKILGIKVLDYLYKEFNTRDTTILLEALKEHKDSIVTLKVEVNKNTLSSGEKQIFIMTLYYSMIVLNNKKIPFIIDTPFARIDMDNRINLTKNFFRKLKGQVFILSTDKEIESKHKEILEDKLAVIYQLTNDRNNGTKIHRNNYFEVKDDI